ncbi:cellular retinaldehyde-binding/triple function domain-containing protein [Heterostelium album PN500]|uniref:Cellular retinaldehyde-binding/triple function domain-containing protein n=1 Tax=Heterostelium pallidum (strain ATCC 26659 / Pp 5 / PN500) TaxID=670386 RepID=D3B401_HETP5|nr:cellular retinaldehyde-binding/triple function domain-containing protein [Heterostelium album PN500]EFA84049.1 cellular retinaldehyde-binding/triple function domain-containing protein [Heterostelium album PN500]|eukprot:XP_020436166.1 cellular retinaldehyde-binding/triple function domain-containing protein [Heterostelium album PN500]
MSGFLNDLNDVQRQGLDSFRSKLDETLSKIREELGYPEEKTLVLWTVNLEQNSTNRDIVLLKFLRARDFKLDAAISMFQACLKWRKEFGVDNILTEQFPEYYEKIGEIYRADKDGRPLMFNYYCNIDVDTVFKDGVDQFLRWKVAQMERSIQLLSETSGGFRAYDRESIVVVHDYKDVSMLSMDKRTKQASKATIALLQDNYPEMLARKFFINVPWFFERLYAFFSSFTNDRTRKKFIICSNKTYRRELLQFIDADSLPARYGGIASVDDAKVEMATVKPKEYHQVALGELPSDQLIEWEYIVETNDISFGIVKSADGKVITSPLSANQFVVPLSQHEYNAGSFRIEEPGYYTAIFNNTYSFMNKKVVHFTIKSKPNNNNNNNNNNSTTTVTTSISAATTTTTTEEPTTTTTTNTTTTDDNLPNENKEIVEQPTTVEEVPKESTEEQIDE